MLKRRLALVIDDGSYERTIALADRAVGKLRDAANHAGELTRENAFSDLAHALSEEAIKAKLKRHLRDSEDGP